MARKLAYIVEIATREPIEGTDIARFTFNGSDAKVVASAEAFSPTDLAVYIEPGSILPGYGGLRESTGWKSYGYSSDGILLPLGNYVGHEIKCTTRPATLDDVKTDDGSPLTQEDIEGLEVADLYFFQKNEKGETVRVDVKEGTDLTGLLGLLPVDLQYIESQLRRKADECHNNQMGRTWEDWERMSKWLLHVADDLAILQKQNPESPKAAPLQYA